MHHNEIKITDKNRDTLRTEADMLSAAHRAALKEQERRQEET